MSLKIEKNIEITPKKHKKIEQINELYNTLCNMNHMESVFVPNSFIYRQSIVNKVFPLFEKKYKLRFSLEIRVWKQGNVKGNRIWVIQNSLAK